MTTLKEALDQASKLMDIYRRVHDQLEDGVPWEKVDNGLNSELKPVWKYDTWYAYITQRLLNDLKNIIDLKDECP